MISVIVIGYEEMINFLIASAALTVVFILLFKFLGMDFLTIELQGDELEIKHYSIFPFGRRYNMFKIPLDRIHDAVIKNGFIGSQLIVYQQTAKGLAKYPPLPLLGLSSKDKQELLKVLKKNHE